MSSGYNPATMRTQATRKDGVKKKEGKSNHALDEYSHRCFLSLFSHKYGGTAKIHMAKNLWTIAHATLLIHHDCITHHFTCISVLWLDWWSGSCRCRVTPKFINFYGSHCDLGYVREICLKYDRNCPDIGQIISISKANINCVLTV